MGKKTEKTNFKNNACPCVSNPFDECYCANITSLTAMRAIHYCGNHYLHCPIYEEHFKSRDEEINNDFNSKESIPST